MKPQPIHIIITGGTIDSFYDGTKDTAVPHKHSLIPTYLKGLKLATKTVFSEICMKDSRSLNEENRKQILKTIRQSSHKKFVITHGTYTMVKTGKYLLANLKQSDRTIILTGSFIPLWGITPSDGAFNLGCAFANVATLLPGVYICMNGKAFSADEVEKNVARGTFERKP